MTPPPTERQVTAYLVALARRNMASRDVETVDPEAIQAIMQETTSNEPQKAAAIQQLLNPPA